MLHPHEDARVISIVLADSDPALVRQTIESLHQEYGPITVSGFSESRHAAALVARAKPSLLICSPQLPRVGGMDLITLAQKRWGQLPAIVLVKDSGLGPGRYLRASSTVTYLEKPFQPEALHQCITKLIGLKRRSEGPPVASLSADTHGPLRLGGALGVEVANGPQPGPTDAAAAAPEPVVDDQIAVSAASASVAAGTEPAQAPVSEPGDTAPPLPAPEETSQPPPAHEAAHPEASGSAQGLEAAAALQEGAHAGDHLLSTATPLPVSRPPAQETSDVWFQPPAKEPLESSTPSPSVLAAQSESESRRESESSPQRGGLAVALTATNIKENLAKLESIDGFIGAALADSDNGMCLGYVGGGGGVFNLELAAAANTEVVRSKRKAIKTLNLRDEIEDILISLSKQHHLIRPVRTRPGLFYYLAIDRQRSNLAMARYVLAEVERELPL